MMPCGEVGLIFANIGLGLTLAGQPIVDQALFSAVVIGDRDDDGDAAAIEVEPRAPLVMRRQCDQAL
jgi:hypothetical protein